MVVSQQVPPPAQDEDTRASRAGPDRIHGYAGDPDFMLSLARGLTVLETFSERKRPLTISQIAQRTQLSRASVRRCLYTLEQLGYVGQEAGQFALRPRVLHLGHAYFSSTSLVAQAQPILDKLSAAIGETSALAILEDTEILYLVRSEVRRMLTVSLGLGSRLPAFCTSIGRLLLAQLPAADLEDFFSRAELRPRTMQTRFSRPDLEEIFRTARNAEYVIVDEELQPGLRAIAVPVRSASGEVVAGISASVNVERVTEADMLQRLLPAMQAAATEIGPLIGH